MKKIMLVGSPGKIKEYSGMLTAEGAQVITTDSFDRALQNMPNIRPDGIFIILPQYWEKASVFVEQVRRLQGFSRTPIVYLGGLLEGVDQAILHKYNVRTITLGPVTPNETVRLLMQQVGKY
jgi:two-component SAPR family response regulator